MFICHCATIDSQHKTVLTSISLKCIQFESNYTTRPEILDSIKDCCILLQSVTEIYKIVSH